jgi:hypothetical protein
VRRANPVNNRRKIRLGLKVVHRHQIGDKVVRRISELVTIDGQPKALLGWITLGSVRTPIYLCNLDHSKLRRSSKTSSIFDYDALTVDPRFEALGPQGEVGRVGIEPTTKGL